MYNDNGRLIRPLKVYKCEMCKTETTDKNYKRLIIQEYKTVKYKQYQQVKKMDLCPSCFKKLMKVIGESDD